MYHLSAVKQSISGLWPPRASKDNVWSTGMTIDGMIHNYTRFCHFGSFSNESIRVKQIFYQHIYGKWKSFFGLRRKMQFRWTSNWTFCAVKTNYLCYTCLLSAETKKKSPLQNLKLYKCFTNLITETKLASPLDWTTLNNGNNHLSWTLSLMMRFVKRSEHRSNSYAKKFQISWIFCWTKWVALKF